MYYNSFNKEDVQFNRIPNAAQYKGSDYANAVRVERGITLKQALEIASNDPDIDYFFIVKGGCMVLEFVPGQESASDPLGLVRKGNYLFDNGSSGQGNMRVFHQGDVVFFSEKEQKRWLGSAPGLADVYEKVKA